VASQRHRLSLTTGTVELLDLPGADGSPPLLLLHQGLGSVGLWREFPAELAAATGRRVVAFSRYGHGWSDPPPKPRAPTFMHEEALEVLPEVIARLGLAAPVLVGHSDGASIALIHAASGHEVAGVVAVAPHVFVEALALRSIADVRDTYRTSDLRERMARHHRDPDAAFRGWNDVWLDPEFATWDIRPLLPGIHAPLLLIQGEHDEFGTMAQLDVIERAVAGPVSRVHLDCRHDPARERPQETVAAITRFLSSLADAI
jgi:pimeloyl-ACP methyl ester carboxylesterase